MIVFNSFANGKLQKRFFDFQLAKYSSSSHKTTPENSSLLASAFRDIRGTNTKRLPSERSLCPTQQVEMQDPHCSISCSFHRFVHFV